MKGSPVRIRASALGKPSKTPVSQICRAQFKQSMSPICPGKALPFGHGSGPVGRPTGHVFRAERVRGPVWYAKYRLPDGRQIQKKIGPAWTERGRPASGYFTKRLAEDWLDGTLDQARRGTLVGMVRTGATFAD